MAKLLTLGGVLALALVLLSPTLIRAEHGADHLGDARLGEAIYKDNCVACHGRDGRGTSPGVPDFNAPNSVLARNEGLLTRSDKALLTHLLQGFRSTVEGSKEPTGTDIAHLTIKDLRDVLSYLHVHFHYQTHAHAGERIYNQTCVACHGKKGKGTVPGAPDLTKKRGVMQQSDTILLDHILNGFQSSGSPMEMPAKGANDALTIADLKDVMDYLHQHFHYRTYRKE